MLAQRPRGKYWQRRFTGLLGLSTVISPARGVITVLCMTVAGLSEALGIASLLPVFAVVGDTGAQAKGLGKTILETAASVGITADVNFFLGVLIVGMTLKAVLMIFALRQVGRAAADVATRMRLDLIDALLEARWPFYAGQPVGRLSNAFSTEATQAGEAYNSTAQLFSNLILVLAYLVVAALVSWQLALLSCGVGLFMVLTLNRFVVTVRRTARKQSRLLRAMIGEVADVLGGIKPIKAMGRQARFRILFRHDAMAIRKTMRKQVFAKQASKALQEPILAICLAIGIYAALTIWALPAGEVLVMSILLVKTVMTIGRAQQDLQSLRVNEAGYASIAETIEQTRAAREVSASLEPPAFGQGIEFRNVCFAYGPKPVIADASFRVEAGAITALTGPSGSGKTTIVDIMLGLHEPDQGEVLIDGKPLSQLNLVAWRRMTGYVPQELTLFHETIMANITLGQDEFSREDVERALQDAGAHDFVAALPEGLDTVAGERGARLSGGQRQRIAIARALLHRPKLLILDEATTALDPETEAQIVSNLCSLSRQTGLSILAISHQPAWTRAADHVIRLESGRVADKAPTARIGSRH